MTPDTRLGRALLHIFDLAENRPDIRVAVSEAIGALGANVEAHKAAVPSQPVPSGLAEAAEALVGAIERGDDHLTVLRAASAVNQALATPSQPVPSGLDEAIKALEHVVVNTQMDSPADVLDRCINALVDLRSSQPVPSGLDAETRDYLAWAEADVPPDRTFEDWHDKGTVLLRRLAATTEPAAACESSRATPQLCDTHNAEWPLDAERCLAATTAPAAEEKG